MRTRLEAKSGSACSTIHPNDSNVARCRSTTLRTRASKGTPPRSLNQATRTPSKLRSRGREKLSRFVDGEWRPGIRSCNRAENESEVRH